MENIDWKTRFAEIVYLIQRDRNEIVFLGMTWNHINALNATKGVCLQAHEVVYNHVDTLQVKCHKEINVVQQPPPEGWVNWNVDGFVALHGSNVSCGGVLRNWVSAWLLGFLCNLGSTDVLSSELWAIFFCFGDVLEPCHLRVILDCDSKVVVELISKRCLSSHPYGSLVHLIQQFFNRDWIVRMNHVYRESNGVVGLFGNFGSFQAPRVVCFQSLPFVCSLLLLRGLVARPMVRSVLVVYSLGRFAPPPPSVPPTPTK